MKAHLTLIALAMTSVTTYANAFNQTYFFGDSQTDTGYLGNLTSQVSNPSGKFITNPDKVWAEHVADYYGTSAKSIRENGTNYAVGGALAGDDTVNTAFGVNVTIPATTTQVANYLTSTGGKANPNALYGMTSGANNLLAAQQNPTNATALLTTTANQTASAINSLHNAGAKYIIAPNVPDVGLSPRVRDLGATAQAATTQATSGYNALLTSELAKSDANVIPLNMFHLMQEVAANPSEYGFSNVTGRACSVSEAVLCNQNTLVEANANNSYFFADGLHPTGAGHALIGDYAISVLTAPTQMSSITHNLAQQGSQYNQHLYRQIDTLPENSNSVWVQAGGEKHSNDLGSHQKTPNISLGMSLGDQSRQFGVHLHGGKQEQDWQNGGGYDTQIIGGGAFYRQDFGNIRITGMAGYDHYKIETERHIKLGSATRIHQANGEGLRVSAGVRGAYRIKPTANLSVMPYVSINTQRVDMDAMNENQPDSSTAMAFGKMKHKSVNGEVGVNANWQVAPKTSISGGLNFSHNFADQEEQVSARLRSISSLEFELPAAQLGKNMTTVAIGVQHLIGNSTSLTAGVSGYRGSHDAKGTNMFVGVNHHF